MSRKQIKSCTPLRVFAVVLNSSMEKHNEGCKHLQTLATTIAFGHISKNDGRLFGKRDVWVRFCKFQQTSVKCKVVNRYLMCYASRFFVACLSKRANNNQFSLTIW